LIDVHSLEQRSGGWTASIRVQQGDVRTEHEVTVSSAELVRYGASDPADLVRHSFEFLLEREPATSILRRFAISDISRYFPEFERHIKRPRGDPDPPANL
jgi:hypothetical protein